MASYHQYDTYDSRQRSSRRDDTYSRPRDNDYLKPTTGANEPKRRSGETSADAQNNSYRTQRSPNRHAYDTRYDYPPSLPPDPGRPTRSRRVSPNPRRYSWPPQPTCEDEATALEKEAVSKDLLSEIGKDEAQSRGSVDQEPIVLDVPEYINKDERRFVLSRDKPKDDLPTPPTSEDEKARRVKRRPSRLNVNFDKVDNDPVPEMGKRTSTPYSFSQSNRLSRDEPAGERFLSPESLLSPPPTDSHSRRARGNSRSQPSSPIRDSGRRSQTARQDQDYFGLANSESAIDDSEHDARDSMPRRGKDKPATYPPTRDASNAGARTSVVDFASQSSSMPARRLNLDSRRNTDTEGTLPTLSKQRLDQLRRPTPLATATAIAANELGGQMFSSPKATLAPSDFPSSRSRDPSYGSAHYISPAGSVNEAMDSPRVSSEFSRDPSLTGSPTASRAASVSDSRPQSPSPCTPGDSPRLPRTDLDWSALLAVNAKRRSQQSNRLSSSMRPEPTPGASRMDPRPMPPMRMESLPYPVDDGPWTPTVFMPSERQHQYFPETRPSATVPAARDSRTLARALSPAPDVASLQSAASRKTRPAFPSRHSTADLPQAGSSQQSEKPRPTEPRRVIFNNSSQTKKEMQIMFKKGLPSCPRTKPVAGYSDWYTILGAPSIEICPDCVESVFEKTSFRSSLRRSPPGNLDAKVHCSLGGSPWIRLAYLITLYRERKDLKLLVDIAEIEESSTPCPGNDKEKRTWYGLRDADGIFVKDFRVCFSDVRKVECLCPTLSGMFVRLPQRLREEVGLCAIRPEGNRFSIYIDALIKTHENALASRQAPNSAPFISLVQWRSRLRECSKDNFVTNGLWHFIPGMEYFTVCEDCFETVVEPEVEKGTDLAMRFNRSIQPVYTEGIGSSCQLYSARMRRVFKRAIDAKDIKYLSRKAKERREAETRLQERWRATMKKYERLSWDDEETYADNQRRLRRDITRITQEWQAEWE